MSGSRLLAPHAQDKIFPDNIFAVNALAKETAKRIGFENIVNGSIGVLLDDDAQLVLLDSVDEASKTLAPIDISPYAPIAGVPEFREDVMDYLLGDQRNAIPTECIATAGATGAIRILLWNALEPGQSILTHDHFWSPYGGIARDMGLNLTFFPTVNAAGNFNVQGAIEGIEHLFTKQDRVVLIINTPCHNPTGISLRSEDVAELKSSLVDLATTHPDKTVFLLIDGAYWEFGDPQANHDLLQTFRTLPDNLVFTFAFSIAKSLTRYGMRVGALLMACNDQAGLTTFKDTLVSSIRGTWSNTNRFGQALFCKLYRDEALWAKLLAEQAAVAKLCNDRGQLFKQEAEAAGVPLMPYHRGFFATIPQDDPAALASRLQEDHLYFVPLKLGVRIAFCAIPSQRIPGLAAKIASRL